MKWEGMKAWLGSRLNRKIFLSLLAVSLIPLGFVYYYINSVYSEKLMSDAFNQNQLTERNTAVLLEDYLTRIEYISNLFFDSDTQAMIRSASNPLSNYSTRVALERKVRVNLDLFKVMGYVDQVTFLKKDGTLLHVITSHGYEEAIPFAPPSNPVDTRFKNQRLMKIEEMAGEYPEKYSGKYVYLRQVDDLNLGNGALGWLYIVFDRERFDSILKDLRDVMNTDVVLNDGRLPSRVL